MLIFFPTTKINNNENQRISQHAGENQEVWGSPGRSANSQGFFLVCPSCPLRGALLVGTTWAPQVLGHRPLWQGQSPPPRTKENPGGSPPGSDTGHHSALWPESATRPHPRQRGQAVKFYHVPMTAPVTAIFTGRTMTLPTELKTGARNGRRNSHNGHQVSQRTFHWLRLRAWRESSGHIHKLSLSLGQLWSNVRAQTEPPQGPTPSPEGGG